MSGHGIGDEPHLRPSTAPTTRDPDGGIAAEPHVATATAPFADRFAAVPAARRWAVAAGAALAGGPIAVLTAFLSADEHRWGALNLVVVGPLVEEVAKNLPALWLCERAPWLLPRAGGILLAALGAGLGFATIENLLYLQVYVPDPSPALVHWRWTVCVALHMGCAAIGALGIARARGEAERLGRRGRIETMAPALVLAAVVHGAYNFIAVVMAGRWGF